VAPGTDPRAGLPSLAVFRFRGVAPGVQPVELRYKRPNEEAASRTIRFEVAVR
jgi:predicted secreted protein